MSVSSSYLSLSPFSLSGQDVINGVPPHWSQGVIEQYGSRWAGQGITTDSRVAAGAPPRLTGAANPRNSHPNPHTRPPRLDFRDEL
jgi:hypothetical protein